MRMRAIERSQTSSRTSMCVRSGRTRTSGPTIPRGSSKTSQRNSRNTSSTGRRTLVRESRPHPKRKRIRMTQAMTSGSAASRPPSQPPKCRHRQRRWAHRHPINTSHSRRRRRQTCYHSTNLHRRIVVSSRRPARATSWTCLAAAALARLQAI